MKRILFFIPVLLHVLCNAHSVVFVAPEASLNPIVSDIRVHVDYQGANAARTVNVPNFIAFSTQHASLRHHTAAPQYDLNRMNTEQLVWYFASRNYTEADILSHPMLYMNPAYLVLVKQLPRYPEFVKKYYDDYRNYKGLRSLLGKMTFCYRHGMRKQFAFLHQECENERITQEIREQERRRREAAQKQEEQEKKEAAEREAYIDELKRIETILSDSPCKRLAVYNHQKRIDTIRYTQQHPERVKRQLKAGAEVFDFVSQHGITEKQITEPLMNAYEWQVHAEFIAHIHSALALQRKYDIAGHNIFIDALSDGIVLGMKSNYLHNSEWATRWSDFCYEATEIVKGIGEGILLGSYNTVDMVMHPVRTLVRMVDGVRMLGSLTARTIGTLVHWNYLIERGKYFQCATEMYAVGEQLIDMASAIHEHTSQMSKREIAKHVTAFGTEWILTGQMLAIGHKLCSKLDGTIKNVIRFLKDEGAPGEFALATTEGVLLKASEDMSKSGGSGSGINKLIRNSRTILETAHAEYMKLLKDELDLLHIAFDNKIKGFAEFAKKYIKFEYQHILGIEELTWGRKGFLDNLKGFHHDYMSTFKKNKVFEFTDQIMHEHGFYKATVLHENRIVKNMGTFFPDDWSRKKVIDKICEAYEDFIKSALKPEEVGGKYTIEGFIDEGIKIRMHITKNGVLKTAYPILD